MKKFRFVIFLFSVLPVAVAAAQTAKPDAISVVHSPGFTDRGDAGQYSPELTRVLERLQRAALSDDYAYRQLAHLTEQIGPRLAGSPQANAAAEYVAGEMRKLGLETHLEQVKVPHWVRGAETAELVEYPGQVPGTSQKIVLTALGGSPATPPGGITAPVVVVSSFDELRALGKEKVAGKIVLFNVPFDEDMAAAGYAMTAYAEDFSYRAYCAKAAAPLGAVAALVRSIGSGEYRLPHTGMHSAAGIPAAAVAAEDARLIADLVREGPVRMHLVLTPVTLPAADGYNVIADLKGSEQPQQIVVVSGHLDSWDLGTGAIDDGAGVVLAMETVELVHRLGLRPRRTIRVIAWVDEEETGSGHRAYSNDYRAEFPNHVGAIESDSGAGQPLGFMASASKQALASLGPMMDILRSSGTGVLLPVAPEAADTDIAPLARVGVPSFGMMQDRRTYFIYHHTAADTLDKVEPLLLERNAAAMAVLAYTLADLPQPLPR